MDKLPAETMAVWQQILLAVGLLLILVLLAWLLPPSREEIEREKARQAQLDKKIDAMWRR